MRYQISGKQIDIGSALQQHVKAEIDGVASKYAERPTDAVVVFSSRVYVFYAVGRRVGMGVTPYIVR